MFVGKELQDVPYFAQGLGLHCISKNSYSHNRHKLLRKGTTFFAYMQIKEKYFAKYLRI